MPREGCRSMCVVYVTGDSTGFFDFAPPAAVPTGAALRMTACNRCGCSEICGNPCNLWTPLGSDIHLKRHLKGPGLSVDACGLHSAPISLTGRD
jgi:hypothetical protein